MTIDKVKKLSNHDRLIYWITERESIRLKKEAGEPSPWTDDEILSQFRFCNVRRMDDKVSQWLYNNWYKPNYNHWMMPVNVTFAREINRIETLEEIGFSTQWDGDRVLTILNSRQSRGLKNFSSAYMITGTLGGSKAEQVVHKVAGPVYYNPPEIDRTSMEQTVKNLIPYAGFSWFIAGQVVADLRWAMEGTWADKDTWAPIGPGSRRGLKRLYGFGHNEIRPIEETYQQLRETTEWLKKELPSSIGSVLEAIDFQSCMCEYDKYTRALVGDGRPKQRYTPGGGA